MEGDEGEGWLKWQMVGLLLWEQLQVRVCVCVCEWVCVCVCEAVCETVGVCLSVYICVCVCVCVCKSLCVCIFPLLQDRPLSMFSDYPYCIAYIKNNEQHNRTRALPE